MSDEILELVKAALSAESSSEAPKVQENFTKKNMNVTIREIKNGYIVHRSWDEGDGSEGCCWNYKSEEEYYAENPLK